MHTVWTEVNRSNHWRWLRNLYQDGHLHSQATKSTIQLYVYHFQEISSCENFMKTCVTLLCDQSFKRKHGQQQQNPQEQSEVSLSSPRLYLRSEPLKQFHIFCSCLMKTNYWYQDCQITPRPKALLQFHPKHFCWIQNSDSINKVYKCRKVANPMEISVTTSKSFFSLDTTFRRYVQFLISTKTGKQMPLLHKKRTKDSKFSPKNTNQNNYRCEQCS